MQHNSTACAQPIPPRRHRPTPANPPRPPRTMPSLGLRQRRLRSPPQATWTRSPSVRGSGAAPSTAPTRRACSVQIRASTRTTGRAMCRNTATRETTPTAAGWRRLSLGRCPMRSADCRAGRRSRKCTCILLPKTVCLEYRCSSLLALGARPVRLIPFARLSLQRCRSRSQGLRREPWPRRHSAFGNVLAVRTHYPVRPPHLANDSAAETCGCGCGNRIAHTFVVRVHAVRQHRPIRTARRAPSRPLTRRSPSHRRPMVRGRGLRSATGRILCDRRRRRRRCEPSRLSQGCLFKWAGRDAPAGARPADRPGGSVSFVLSHAADAAVLRRPCAAPHCVSAWGDVLQLSSREQVHRHDRELGW